MYEVHVSKENNQGTSLKEVFELKKQSNPKYSLRSLARDMGISPSFLSKIMNGKKPLPEKYIGELSRRLNLDAIEVEKLKKSTAAMRPFRNNTRVVGSDNERLRKYTPMGRNDLPLLEKWYYIAILDLSTCENFKSNIKWIAERLKLSESLVEDSVKWLLEKEYLIQSENGWKKSDRKMRFPADSANPTISNFHGQLLSKVIKTMERDNNAEKYKGRAIHSTVVAGNPENLEKAQKILIKALYKATEVLTEGDCTEVYQLNVNQIPITENSK